jgi:2-polyprenyl-3-methyl-5-hydroxy-6-metoxy-1,4-benzoquinol methylase
METREREVVLFIVDISGYTNFILSNEKELAHSQIIIRELLTTLLEEIKIPLQLIRLEGDAAFLYAFRDDPAIPWQKVSKNLVFNLMTFFRVFSNKVAELTIHKICNCNACVNIERLKLKVVAHSGTAAFFQINDIQELTGKDPIIVHRLLKNSVNADEYILLTEPAFEVLTLPDGQIDEGEETYDDIGTLKTYIYYPPDQGPYTPDPNAKYPEIFVETLRSEVAEEYAQVAEYPELGFHFHVGRRLANLLEYKEEWLQEYPEKVIESFAGTGNPFTLGILEPGERVLDVGCGAGLDSLIAARMVGTDGEVIGVDMTPAMVEKARKNASLIGVENVSFLEGFSEELPVPDEWADVIISNGATNLSPNKEVLFQELNRVLKPGGRLQIADILIQKAIPDAAKRRIELWSG